MMRTDPLRTEQEVNSFLTALAEWNKTYYIGCVIGINWGLRASDILNLKVGDVLAGSGNVVRIVDRLQLRELKTGKVRNIMVTSKMRQILGKYIRSLQSRDDYSLDLPLVLSRVHNSDGSAKALSRVEFWRIIDKTSKKLGYKRGSRSIGTHSLRKTYAYMAWRSGVRVDELQKEFGHSSTLITQRYACIPDERLDRIYLANDFGNVDRVYHDKKRVKFPQKGQNPLNCSTKLYNSDLCFG